MDGIVLVDKEKGITTYDIIRRIKACPELSNISKRLKIGHGGALDPFATGLVVILFGSYTRLTNFFHTLPKKYVVTIQIGVVTDSLDITGKILKIDPDVELIREQVLQTIDEFKGKIVQTPPELSSVKIQGKPAYWYFYRNQPVEIKPRSTEIREIKLLELVARDKIKLYIECGKGFYVRSFAQDLGCKLGYSGGIACDLVRTHIGPFSVDHAIHSTQLDDTLVPCKILDLCPTFKTRTISRAELLQLQHGEIKIRKKFFDDILSDESLEPFLLVTDSVERGLVFFENSPQLVLF